MDAQADRKVVLVTRRTRLEELLLRFHTLAQAKFYIEHLGADFGDYLKENENYVRARRETVEILEAHGRYQIIDRAFLPNFLFAPDDVVATLGQDGLVANTIKYLDGQPLIGLNPDTYRYDGVLLPFEPRDLGLVLQDTLRDQRQFKLVTMAKATLADNQSLYAVNDLFIGPRSHTSARYEIQLGLHKEVQSSSGIIISTGVGSTGWMKSVVTGSLGVVSGLLHRDTKFEYSPMPWDAKKLRFAVREPFPSKASEAKLIFGDTDIRTPLTISSMMPEHGVIFSDGIEADFLEFNSGAKALISVAEREGRLVI
ncbi:MAG TPA: sugar kinase [Gallionellaceae bacterium]|nr:sugar kinase [Gallionellaceae bacterium]